MILFVKTGCPYCIKVLNFAKDNGIDFELRNIADDAVAASLIQRGGKRQVPYLVDAERGVEMYESDDINAYLREQYAKK